MNPKGMEPKMLILLAVCVAALLLVAVIARRRPRRPRPRSRVKALGFYEWGDGHYDISFYRDDPRRGGDTLTEYREFTGASAQRVQRLIEDGEVGYCEDGRGRVLKRFPRGKGAGRSV